MRFPFPATLRAGIALLLVAAPGSYAANPPPTSEPPVKPIDSPVLQRVVDHAVHEVLGRFAPQGLQPEQVAVTLVDLRDPARPGQGAYRGEVPIYPASVVKLFYLVAAEQWLEDGRLPDTRELQRALTDMIVDSSNEATHYVVDVLTGTTSGPELGEVELGEWQERRNAVNRYFAGQGYAAINVNKKPWNDGPYGRETQAIERFTPKRNFLTTDATARLLTAIVTGRAVSAARSAAMLRRMARDLAVVSTDPEAEVCFFGPGLPVGARLWSKAGWTSETRHAAACVELPDGRRLVLVAFTTGHANEREILPALARAVIAGLP